MVSGTAGALRARRSRVPARSSGGTSAPRRGWWHNEYKNDAAQASLETSQLECYLEIARYVSTVFDEEVALAGFGDAEVILMPPTSKPRHLAHFDRELLTALLNFANGAVDYDEVLVDTDDDNVADATVGEVITAAELVRLDPGASRADVEEHRSRLHGINQA